MVIKKLKETWISKPCIEIVAVKSSYCYYFHLNGIDYNWQALASKVFYEYINQSINQPIGSLHPHVRPSIRP